MTLSYQSKSELGAIPNSSHSALLLPPSPSPTVSTCWGIKWNNLTKSGHLLYPLPDALRILKSDLSLSSGRPWNKPCPWWSPYQSQHISQSPHRNLSGTESTFLHLKASQRCTGEGCGEEVSGFLQSKGLGVYTPAFLIPDPLNRLIR